MKLEKISNNVLFAVCGLIVLAFLLFYTVGYDNIDAEISTDKVAPKMTILLMMLMYLLGAATFCLMVWSLITSARNSGGSDEATTKGVPAKRVVLLTSAVTLLIFIIGFAISYAMGEDAVIGNDGKEKASAFMVVVVDAFMVEIYALSLMSIVSVVIASTGVMTKSATKK